MVNKADKKVDINKKTKRLKIAGWSTGVILMGVGIPLMGRGIAWAPDESGFLAWLVPGVVLTCTAPIITTGCVIRANKLKKQVTNRVTSTPIWQNEFQLSNNATLSTQICTIQDVQQKAPTLGFGLSYQF